MNFATLYALLELKDQFTGPLAAISANSDAATLMIANNMSRIGVAAQAAQKEVEAFSGANLLQQATAMADAIANIGGVSKLTADEQASVNQVMTDFITKADLMGTEVPEQFRLIQAATAEAQVPLAAFSDTFKELLATAGLAIGAGAFAEAIAGAVEFGSSLEHLSIATGISTDQLQQLNYAAVQFNVPLQSLAMSIDRMQKNIETGAPVVKKAFDDLGLSLSAIKTMAPDQVLLAVSDAASKIPDHMRAVNDVMAIFGRTSPEMIALVLSNINNLTDGTQVMSESTVKALDELDSSWAKLKLGIETSIGDILGRIQTIPGVINVAVRLVMAPGAGPSDTVTWLDVKNNIDQATESAGKDTDAMGAAAAASLKWGTTLGSTVDSLKDAERESQAMTAEVNKHIAAVEGLESVYSGAKLQESIENTTIAITAIGGASKVAADALPALTKQLQAWQAAGVALNPVLQAVLDRGEQMAADADEAKLTAQFWQQVSAAVDEATGVDKERQMLVLAEAVTDLGGAASLTKDQTAFFDEKIKALKVSSDELNPVLQDVTTNFWSEQAALNAMNAELDKLAAKPLSSMFPDMKSGAQSLIDYNKYLNSTMQTTNEWDKGLTAVGKDFQVLASVSTGTMSTIAADLGKATAALKNFGDSIGSIGAVLTDKSGKPILDASGLTQIDWGKTIGGLTGVIGAFISLGSWLTSVIGGADKTQKALQALGAAFQTPYTATGNTFAANAEALKELQGQATLTMVGLGELLKGIDEGGTNATTALTTLKNLLPSIETNFSLSQATAADLFKTIKTGGADSSAALTDLDQMVTDFQNQAATTSGIWSPQFQALIQQSQQLGQNVASITAALKTQAANATTGLNQALGVTAAAYTAAAADQTTIATSKTAADIQKATDDLAVQQNIIQATQIKTQASASGLAAAAVAAVDANMKAGMSFVDAAKAAEPAIEGLKQQLQATGFQGSAAFTLLSNEADLLTDKVAGPAITAVEGYTEAMVSLANTGSLTQDAFTGLESQIGSTYATLIAQGKNGQAVLAAMQPDLQAAWQAEQQYGFTADDATQKLIDQGVQAGLVGEKQKSATDQMIDALNKIVDLLQQTVQGMTGPNGIAAAATSAATTMNRSFGSVTGPKIYGVPAGADAASTTPADVTVADIPLSTVTKSGLIWVRAGYDYVGGVPKGASGDVGGASTTTSPLAGSNGGGQMTIGGDTYQITVTGADDPQKTADAVVDAIVTSGSRRTLLTNQGVVPILQARGLVS